MAHEMSVSFLRIAILIGMFVPVSAELSDCVKGRVDECVKLLEVPYTDSYIFHLKITDIDVFCRRSDLFENCLLNLTASCRIEKHKQYFLRGLINSHLYICGDGIDGFIKYHDCLNLPEVQETNEDVCAPRINSSIEELTNRDVQTLEDVFLRIQDTCSIFPDYKRCVRKVAELHCGDKAGEYLVKVFDIIFDPLIEEYYGCSYFYSWGIYKWIFYFMFALIVAGMVACVVVCVRRYRKYRRRSPPGSVGYRHHPTMVTGETASGGHPYGHLQDVTVFQHPKRAGSQERLERSFDNNDD